MLFFQNQPDFGKLIFTEYDAEKTVDSGGQNFAVQLFLFSNNVNATVTFLFSTHFLSL